MLDRTSCRLFLLSLFNYCLASSTVQGQSFAENEFSLHTVRSGLSHNMVTTIEQDDLGYMWIGTDGGLNRFDGYAFNNYAANTAPLFLASGFIRKITKFGKEQIAVLSRQGLQVINSRNLMVQNYFIPDQTAFKAHKNAAWDALLLPDKSVALTTATGFYVFNQQQQLLFKHDAYQLADVGKKRIFYGRFMLPLSETDLLLFVEENKVAHYNIPHKRLHELEENEHSLYNFYPVATTQNRGLIHHERVSRNEYLFLHFARNSIVYYNTATKKNVTTLLPVPKINFSWESKIFKLTDSTYAINGGTTGFYLLHLNRQTGKITMNPVPFLNGYKILCMKYDKDEKLWLGTSRGLLQQKESNHFLKSYDIATEKKESITGGLSCAFRYKNNLYLGRSSYNNGITIVDPVTKKIKKQLHFFQANSTWNEIMSIQMYHPDTLYIGSSSGLIWLDTKTNHYGKVTLPAEIDRSLNVLAPVAKDGYAWMLSLLNGMVVRYQVSSRTFKVFTSNSNPALPFTKIKHICYDSFGDVWIGGHSLARWNSRLNNFDTLITVYSGMNKFNENILMLHADSHGSLWIHNAENGLLQYRIKDKRWGSFGIKDGLPSDVFESFSPVIDENIWLGSSGNLTCFNVVSKQSIVYDFSDGYSEDAPKSRKIEFDSVSNQLYLFANQQMTGYASRPAKNTEKDGEIIIQELQINNKKSLFHPFNRTALQHYENNLSLSFSILDFENTNYRFFYKMNEKDDWIALKGTRNINLSALNAGNYSVYLKAIGKWGAMRQTAFSFLILKPWWESLVFKVAMVALAFTLLIILYRLRIKQVKFKAGVDKKLAQTEMKALHAQMNPHFISNSLNSIREMILNDDNKAASRYLTKFAHLIRITLDHSLMPFISLRNTVDYLNRYAEMEMIRSDKFTFKQNVTEELALDEAILPPMLIQPFIENAIWHGANAKRIDITVNFSQEDNQLVCVIEDNGIGIGRSLEQKNLVPHLKKSIGIQNIRNRIQLLNEKYNMKSSIAIEDKSDWHIEGITGTIVTIKLKLKTDTYEPDQNNSR